MNNRLFIFLGTILSGLVLFLGILIGIIYRDFNLRVSEIFVAEEDYQSANIIVETEEIKGTLTPSFAAFAQGGEEMGVNMLAGTEVKMKLLLPKYIRIDHVFDDDYYGVYKEGVINFAELDKTVDSILAMGAKPFFSLSYMPKAIAENKIDKAKDKGRWRDLVRATILHYSKEKAISDVYYEVWNEPDLESFGGFKYYGEKNYLELYEDSAIGARQAREQGAKAFKIGGPATTGFYENWAKVLINYCEKNNLALDFISWHRYSYLMGTFQEDIARAKEVIRNSDYELVISEWGPDSEKTNIYSTSLAAAHAVAIADKFIEDLDWAMAFEVKDGPEQENFGWGVLNYEKGIKPRYKAFEMMKDMTGDYLRLSGEGSNVSGWAIKDEKGEVRLILTNYSNIQIGKEEVLVDFSGLRKGSYEVSWETLNGEKRKDILKTNEEGVIGLNFVMKEFEVLKIRINRLY